MSNLPIVSFESVDLLAPQPTSGSNPQGSEDATFDSYLKEAGNSLGELETNSQEFDGSESADVPASAPSDSSHEDKAPLEDNADQPGSAESGENAETVSTEAQGKPSGENAETASEEGQGEVHGKNTVQAGGPNQPAGHSANGKEANLVLAGKLPFPQLR